MPPLNIPTYRIMLEGSTDVHQVMVLPQDMLRAETEGNSRGLVDARKQAIMLTYLWLWAACRRTGLVDGKTRFEAFVNMLTAWEKFAPIDPEIQADLELAVDLAEDGAGLVVRPTLSAGSTPSPSPSPGYGPGSTGSPPSTPIPPSSPPPSPYSVSIAGDPGVPFPEE